MQLILVFILNIPCAKINHHQHQQMILGDSSGSDEDHEVEVEVEVKTPKKQAKTWVQAEVGQALVRAYFIGDERKMVQLITHYVHRQVEELA